MLTFSGRIKASSENAVCVWVGVPSAGSARTGRERFMSAQGILEQLGERLLYPPGRAGAR